MPTELGCFPTYAMSAPTIRISAGWQQQRLKGLLLGFPPQGWRGQETLGQSFTPICCHQQSVLKLCTALTISGDSRPLIRPCYIFPASGIDHGLYCEQHALSHDAVNLHRYVLVETGTNCWHSKVLQMTQLMSWQRVANMLPILKTHAPCCGNSVECLERNGTDLISHAHRMSEQPRTCKGTQDTCSADNINNNHRSVTSRLSDCKPDNIRYTCICA